MKTAIALLELTSIVRGYRVADDMVKKAPVDLVDLGIVSPGKYLILVSGGVGEVEEAHLAGLESAGEWLLDQLFLPQPHPGLVQALLGTLPMPTVEALGLIEAFSAIATVRAADLALKAADVAMVALHYQKHLGGKGYFALTGVQHDVEAALEAAVESLQKDGLLLTQELISRPHDDFVAQLSAMVQEE